MENKTRIVVWWCIPCKGVFPIFEAYEKQYGNVRFIVENENSADRIKLGWEAPGKDKLQYESLSHNKWETTVKGIIGEEKNSIHIFNGIFAFPKIQYALQIVYSQGLKYGFFTEAPFNPYQGLKKIAKDLYTYNITKFRIRKYRGKADFVFCASGDAGQKLKKMGWPQHKIIPYGYFTNCNNPGFRNKTNDTGKIKLLCTGYITKNKGHKLLLRALNMLGAENKNFELNITGFGPEQNSLKNYASENKLKNINFLGVIPTSKLNSLMQESDVVIAPGYEEPWGIRINEAINFNLAVIVSDGVGASVLVGSFECGQVFKSGDVTGLANCLLKYKNTPGLLEGHKRNTLIAKVKISPNHAATVFYNSLTNIYALRHCNITPAWLRDF